MATQPKPTRRLQTQEDLENQFDEQFNFLVDSCNNFDRGNKSEAKRIAAIIRVLVHDTHSSTSLLKQIGRKILPFYDSRQEYIDSPNIKQLMAPLSLVSRLPGNNLHHYKPHFGIPEPIEKIKFDKWWEQTVIQDKAGNKFTRKSIVLSMANQDGGSHVDPSLEETYYKLTRLNSVEDSFVLINGDITIENLMNATEIDSISPAFYTVRQIAHEIFFSQIDPKKISIYVTFPYIEKIYTGVAWFNLGISEE